MNILIIQAREQAADHEYAAILTNAGLAEEDVRRVNIMQEDIDTSVLEGIDGVIIGGSGENNVSKGQPDRLDQLAAVVREIVDRDIPLLAICYGSHVLAYALGGTVEYRPETKEVKTATLTRLESCPADDPLFGDMPEQYAANCGRTDDITQLPENATSFYRSDAIDVHVFKIDGKRAYGVASHPELNKKEQQERIDMAAQNTKYFESQEEVETLKAAIYETPENTALLKKFLERIV